MAARKTRPKTKAATKAAKLIKAALSQAMPEPPTDDILIDLSPQQQVFAFEYLKDWNGTRAAKAAGYAGNENVLSVQAHRLLRNAKVQEFIKRHVETVAMGANEILLRLAEIGRGNLAPFLYGDSLSTVDDDELSENAVLSLDTKAARNNIHLLKKAKRKRRHGGDSDKGTDWTEIEDEIELHDKIRALELLGKYHKLWTEKHEVGGPGGGPLPVMSYDDLRALPRPERQRLLREALGESASSQE